MKKLTWWAVAMLVAVPAFAGSGEKCSENAQACLNHWSQSQSKGWSGMKTEKNAEGAYVVKEVMTGSPAATAGIQAGDVLIAVNGANMADKEAVKKAKGAWSVGQNVSYTVKRAGADKTLAMTLGTMPSEVFASMVGAHMLENHVAMTTADAATAGDKGEKAMKEGKK